MAAPILSVQDLCVDYPVPGQGLFGSPGKLRAVDNVSFELQPGETLGIVGESGCGKSSLARAVLGLAPVTAGEITFMSQALSQRNREGSRYRHRELQIIFQDPLASLNPRMTVGQIISEPLQTHYPDMLRKDCRARVLKAMKQVGLSDDQFNRYPHEFSGGQCQRIGIARALVLEPRLIICDEPVSALDVSVRAQIINLLMSVRDELGLSLVFIAHDLGVVRHLCDRVLVMYLGRAVEYAVTDALFAAPRHPYTQALMAAVPVADPQRQRTRRHVVLRGEVPSPINPPSGCAFRTRCRWATERCVATAPSMRLFHHSEAACHRLEEIAGQQALDQNPIGSGIG